ncbi:acyl-CoA dehydrogenase family protein [Cellulosimicrobium funkei]
MTPTDTRSDTPTRAAGTTGTASVTDAATAVPHPAPRTTHRVTNQPPEREGVNEYLDHPVLREAVHAYGGAWGEDRLVEVGALVGTGDFQRAAELANVHEPVLRTHDRRGHRIDEVEYHPAYHEVIGAAVAHGAHTSAWAEPGPGANVVRGAVFSLFAQVEPGHACPVSMTHAAVPSLRHAPSLAAMWEPRLLSRGYDGALAAPGSKPGVLVGMAMTEKQGGSDVRANATTAVPAGADGAYLLTGHKWFCSAPMSDAFLVLAQVPGAPGEGAPSCFLVPRVLEDGTRNVFRIQRLKEKLGNRSNASSEIELDGTVGFLVGEPGRGVRTIIEMVSRTRLDCVHGSAAGMRQAVTEALWHARHRSAFGAALVDQPAMTAVLADLALESEAATLTSVRLAAAHDGESEHDRAFRRLATAVSKYWVCKRGPHHAYEAMECLGGNGYTEAFPLARRYREQPVMAIWEGSGNVIALDVLRAMGREPASVAAFEAELATTAGAHPVLDAHVARTRRLLAEVAGADAGAQQAQARRVVESLALALQASLVVRHAPSGTADAFVAARLGEDRGHGYGVLPRGTDAHAILARHTHLGIAPGR